MQMTRFRIGTPDVVAVLNRWKSSYFNSKIIFDRTSSIILLPYLSLTYVHIEHGLLIY